MIAESTWICGDPGMAVRHQRSTGNGTLRPTRRGSTPSNPYSEYMYPHQTIRHGNLASLNLMKFRNEDDEFDIEAFKHAVDVTILAQEITVDNASYPTKEQIERQLTTTVLWVWATPIWALCSCPVVYLTMAKAAVTMRMVITALHAGRGQPHVIKRIAKEVGPFHMSAVRNEEPMLKVMKMRFRGEAPRSSARARVRRVFHRAAQAVWKEVQTHGKDGASATARFPFWRRPAPSAS